MPPLKCHLIIAALVIDFQFSCHYHVIFSAIIWLIVFMFYMLYSLFLYSRIRNIKMLLKMLGHVFVILFLFFDF